MIPDRLVVRNVEHVHCYFLSGNPFSEKTNNIINSLPVERRRVVFIVRVQGACCVAFNVVVIFKDVEIVRGKEASSVGRDDNMSKDL